MRNSDAGHSHGPTPYLVTGCPLCDHQRTVRNQAIHHLTEAIHLLSLINSTGTAPTIRLNLAPIGLTGDDVPNCHSVDLTAKQAETVADAVDSVNAYAGSQPTDEELGAIEIDEDRMAQTTARFMGWLQGQAGEVIESGDYSAAAVAQCYPDLYADVTDVFMLLDPREITKTVLDDRQVDLLYAVQALDDVYGDVHDPYADEDGDA